MNDFTGMKVGRLQVIERNGSRNNMAVWKCRCDCGNIVDVMGRDLKRGHTKSCGCLHKEGMIKRLKTHGGTHERLYAVWQTMKKRCQNKNNKGYKYYGARGVKICCEWNDYSNFKQWAYTNGYDDKAPYGECTIDRIDVNGDYEPKNCRWVSMAIQNSNKRKKMMN